jgi:hypothetical protein
MQHNLIVVSFRVFLPSRRFFSGSPANYTVSMAIIRLLSRRFALDSRRPHEPHYATGMRDRQLF